ncbi:cilia- and flagella-associated protein 53 isoform X2 [Betta splendens]|uniref:Cilia- and flagella-associated protein 53 n=1 Tax=Betta splendens TaxID=158456 RepID=A0A9W2Y5Y9_BETSP|nr:cilia- and flagella-associated protein 53 isoform X2 [Betta splendens]
MLLGNRTRCREVTGPTPHSVAVRARVRSVRPADQLILERQKQEADRGKVLEFSRYQQNWGIKNSWLQSSERRFLGKAVQRHVEAAVRQQESRIEERRNRLRALLEVEEQELLQQLEETKETTAERQTRMRNKAEALRTRRETERQQLVSDRLEQVFRDQCEELRTLQSKRREQQVSVERAAQVRSRQEQQQRQQQEEKLFEELWEADRRAKDKREKTSERRQRQRNAEQLDVLRSQVEAAEQQKLRERELREEEARLRLQQQEMQKLQQQRQQQLKLRDQRTRRRELDLGFRLRMKRLAREQQEELELDMSILQQLLGQERDERQEAAQRKVASESQCLCVCVCVVHDVAVIISVASFQVKAVNVPGPSVKLREEQRRYRQHLSDELHKQKREDEETELLIEEKLKETWTKREEQSQRQREARNRLMSEVMEARSLQIQHRLDLNSQRQAELTRDRDELNRALEEMRLKDEEDRRCQKQTCEEYQAQLRAQMEQQQHLRREERAQDQREYQQALARQQLYEQKKEQILSRPMSHTTAPHPFRRAEGSRSAPGSASGPAGLQGNEVL